MVFILPGGLGQIKAGAPAGSTWSPTRHSTLLTLSNGNLTVTGTSTTFGSGAGSKAITANGQYYFEVTAGVLASQMSVGLVSAVWTAATGIIIGADGNGVGVVNSGGTWAVLSNNTFNYFGSAAAAGDVIGVAVNIVSGSAGVYSRVNTLWIQNGTPTMPANPDNPTALIATACSPAYTVNSASSWTLNTTGPFANAPPAGYVAWG